MINPQILDLLRQKTGKDIHGIYRLIEKDRKARGYAIRKETAAYILAGQMGIDIAEHLDDEDLYKVAGFLNISRPFIPQDRSVYSNAQQRQSQKIYGKGQSYNFYLDFYAIIKSAKKEVLILDAYLDEEIFNLYVGKLKANVVLKILTKNPKSSFITVAQKFKLRPRYSLEVRGSQDVHDRMFLIDGKCWVAGQSVKDAGKKPTYLITLTDPKIKTIIYDMWNNGTFII